MTVWLLAAATLVVSFAATLAARPALRRLGVVDVPSARSSHTTVAIRALGTGIFAAFVLGWAGALAADPATRVTAAVTVLLASAASALAGVAEDFRGLSVPARSAVQLGIALAASAVLVAAAGAPWWLVIYAVLFVSSYINVANFMDGLNGISGLHGIIAGVSFALCGVFSDLPWLTVAGAILAASFAGFLPVNLAGLGFMGDTGSYLLGGATAVTSFAALVGGAPILATIGPMIVYFGDVGVTLVRRVRRGEKWSDPHKEHVYQRIQQAGRSHLTASLIVAAFSAAASALGLLSYALPPVWWIGLLVAGLAVLVGYLALPRLLGADPRPDSRGTAGE